MSDWTQDELNAAYALLTPGSTMTILQCQVTALRAALETMVADDAFADLCEGIGEEPAWLKLARAALARTAPKETPK